MVASVEETSGTSARWPSRLMMDSDAASPISAVRIGRTIAVTVPNANSRMITAAAMPISSLFPSSAFETALPR